MKVLFSATACSLSELIDLLNEANMIAQNEGNRVTIYAEDHEGKDVVVRLIENVLSDGSKTYNVRVF